MRYVVRPPAPEPTKIRRREVAMPSELATPRQCLPQINSSTELGNSARFNFDQLTRLRVPAISCFPLIRGKGAKTRKRDIVTAL